MNELNIL